MKLQCLQKQLKGTEVPENLGMSKSNKIKLTYKLEESEEYTIDLMSIVSLQLN